MDTGKLRARGAQWIGDKSSTLWPGGRSIYIALIVLALLVVIVLVRGFLDYVEPNEFGIKEVKIGVKRGIRDKTYTAGFAFVLPFGLEKMHHFPRDVQVLELTASPPAEKESGLFGKTDQTRHSDKAAKIQTSDGFYVDVDVTILYRIVDPYTLIKSVGPGLLYLHNGILPKAEPILKQALGKLTTENFFNSPLRVEKAETARDLLSAELAPKGIAVEHVLVRYFKYSDEIQKNIEEKKLQDQLVFKNQAEAKAAMEQAKLKRVSQEGEMNVKVTLEEGQAYKVKKDAEKELYVRKKKAEADLLVKLAEANRTELENEAMQVAGSDKMVAMRMADVLAGLDTVIVPSGGATGLNPLDLDQLLHLFGAEVLQQEDRSPPRRREPPSIRPTEPVGVDGARAIPTPDAGEEVTP